MSHPIKETKKYVNWPKVSIVIVNARGLRDLNGCLKSVLKTHYPNFEVIVVDCLTKTSKDFVRRNYPQVRLIHFEKDIGASLSHNIGVKYSDLTSKYAAFLDNDTEVDPGWLTELIWVLEQNPDVGAAQSKLLFLNDRSRFDGAGDFVNYYGETAGNRGRGEKDEGQYDYVDDIFSPRGAAMIARKALFERIGGFDPDFFVYFDDIDFGWRVWLAGFRVIFVPFSVVYHRGASKTKHSYYSVFHDVKNRYITVTKNYGLKNLRYLLVHFCTDVLSILRMVLTAETKVAFVKFKALIWVIANMRLIWKKRLKVQCVIRKVPDEFIRLKIMVPSSNPFPKRLLYQPYWFIRRRRSTFKINTHK